MSDEEKRIEAEKKAEIMRKLIACYHRFRAADDEMNKAREALFKAKSEAVGIVSWEEYIVAIDGSFRYNGKDEK